MTRQTTIELLRPHRHAGRDYPVGARLELRPDQAQWLTAIGVAGKPAGAPAQEPAAPAKTTTTKE